MDRLRRSWEPASQGAEDAILARFVASEPRCAELDRFDRVQLAEVLRVCAASRSLSEAGRALFSASRRRRTTTNDADRLRKYLARFGLTWPDIRAR